MSTEIEKCPSFSNCSAPICLLDPTKENCIWLPDEEICKKNFPPKWVKNQKKIQKRGKDSNNYYTFKMLKRNCVIAKGITGIIPEGIGRSSLEIREKNWLKKHPAKKILTEKEKEVLRERFGKNIGRE